MTPLFCPFCGNEPDEHPCSIYYPDKTKWQVHCPTCEYFGPVGNSPELAIAAWNERHSPYQAEIDQLKKELEELKIDRTESKSNYCWLP